MLTNFLRNWFFLVVVRGQAVCALGSLSVMGDVQNLIICVNKAWSEDLILAGSDCGDEVRNIR